ncbi:hypothetical protein AC249_AIPGENE22874, partial [Exaiptasia diaphana]
VGDNDVNDGDKPIINEGHPLGDHTTTGLWQMLGD